MLHCFSDASIIASSTPRLTYCLFPFYCKRNYCLERLWRYLFTSHPISLLPTFTMAYSPGPPSPGVGAAYGGLHTRGRSNSPPGASGPLSKRDKRRSALQERLHDLTATFSHNRDAQFRQQLHSLQCDMTLITNADPYGAGPLPDSSDDIAQLIEETVGGGKFAKEMASLSGTWYAKFVQEVNKVKEQRDAELAQIMVCATLELACERKLQDLICGFG